MATLFGLRAIIGIYTVISAVYASVRYGSPSQTIFVKRSFPENGYLQSTINADDIEYTDILRHKRSAAPAHSHNLTHVVS